MFNLLILLSALQQQIARQQSFQKSSEPDASPMTALNANAASFEVGNRDIGCSFS
jgi:hypothetical protein